MLDPVRVLLANAERARLLAQPAEVPVQVTGLDRGTDLRGEDQAMLAPVVTHRLPFNGLV